MLFLLYVCVHMHYVHHLVAILCSCLTCTYLTSQVYSAPCTHSSHAFLADLVNTPKADERAIMTYVSCYYHAFQGAQQVNHSWVPLTNSLQSPSTTDSVPITAEGPLPCPYNRVILHHSRVEAPFHSMDTHQPASLSHRQDPHPHLFFSCSQISSLPVSHRICIGLEVVLKTNFHFLESYFYCVVSLSFYCCIIWPVAHLCPVPVHPKAFYGTVPYLAKATSRPTTHTQHCLVAQPGRQLETNATLNKKKLET